MASRYSSTLESILLSKNPVSIMKSSVWNGKVQTLECTTGLAFFAS